MGAAQDAAKKVRNKKDLPEDLVEQDSRFAKWLVMTYQHNVSADQHYHASLERDNAAKMQEEAFRGRSDTMWENNLPSMKELHLLIGVITRHFPCCSHTGALVVLANSGPDHAFLTQLDLSSCTTACVNVLGGGQNYVNLIQEMTTQEIMSRGVIKEKTSVVVFNLLNVMGQHDMKTRARKRRLLQQLSDELDECHADARVGNKDVVESEEEKTSREDMIEALMQLGGVLMRAQEYEDLWAAHLYGMNTVLYCMQKINLPEFYLLFKGLPVAHDQPFPWLDNFEAMTHLGMLILARVLFVSCSCYLLS